LVSDSRSPLRLYLFQVATRTVPGPPPFEMSAGCYLVQTQDGQNILIDSGFPEDYALPDGTLLDTTQNVIAQLGKLELNPDDIDLVICTHLDIDHVGFHDAFPGAEFIIQRQQYELARGGHARFQNAQSHWDHPALRYRVVDGDTELLPGLTLIETSGHTPGHQSVLLRLPETGAVLLAIDAVPLARLFTIERKPWPFDDNEEQLIASTQKLLDLAEREGAMVIFGHDGEQWQSLKKAPEFYG
jgi:N-acyl homoserine lactone hydrolase